MKKPVRYITHAAIIAAVYAGLTIALAPISFGPIQVRIAEAMCILPLFTPAAIPGLAIGCFIANLSSTFGWPDLIIGTGATLIAASLTYFLRRWKWISPLYTVIINAFAVPFVFFLSAVLGINTTQAGWLVYWINVGWIALGETLACFGLGLPLMMLMERLKANLYAPESMQPKATAGKKGKKEKDS
ncbi:MAG: QueT transporter family protein [Bacillota bacterium]|nr:QueT transporter family protein [Bacillota bacterium]